MAGRLTAAGRVGAATLLGALLAVAACRAAVRLPARPAALAVLSRSFGIDLTRPGRLRGVARFTLRNDGAQTLRRLRVSLAPAARLLSAQIAGAAVSPTHLSPGRWMVPLHLLPGARAGATLRWSLRDPGAGGVPGVRLTAGRRWLVAPGWHPRLLDNRRRSALRLAIRTPGDETVVGPGEPLPDLRPTTAAPPRSGSAAAAPSTPDATEAPAPPRLPPGVRRRRAPAGITGAPAFSSIRLATFQVDPGPEEIRLVSARLQDAALGAGKQRFEVYRALGAAGASAAPPPALRRVGRALAALASLLGPDPRARRPFRLVILPGAPTRALPWGLLLAPGAVAALATAPPGDAGTASPGPAAGGAAARRFPVPRWLVELGRLWFGQQAAARPEAASLLEDGAATDAALLALERLSGPQPATSARRHLRRLAVAPGPAPTERGRGPPALRRWARAAMIFETLRTRVGTDALLAVLRDLARRGRRRLLDVDEARAAIAQARNREAASLFADLARTRATPRARAWVRRFENLPSGRFVRVKVQNLSSVRALVPLIVVHAGRRTPARADLRPHAEVVLRVPIGGTMTQAAQVLVDPDARALLEVAAPPPPSASTSPPD